MSNLRVRGQVKQASIKAVVTRADGRVEDLGEIASYKRGWISRLISWLRRKLIG